MKNQRHVVSCGIKTAINGKINIENINRRLPKIVISKFVQNYIEI